MNRKKESQSSQEIKRYDLFIFAGEDSGDLHGSNLINELLKSNPDIKILAVAGPRMRKYPIDVLMKMEDFHVMGFTDVILAIFKILKNFYYLRKKILFYNPKACVFIDYPDFNLRMEKSLKEKGYKNKLIHYICPTVWAWREKRKYLMEKYLDILISIFPFEKKHFEDTKLDIRYIGHPLAHQLKDSPVLPSKEKIVGIFPGSREKEISRNLPIQLEVAKNLLLDDENIRFKISNLKPPQVEKILQENISNDLKDRFELFSSEKNYEVMKNLSFAMATSGTINLELALNLVPTVVNYVIKPLDVFIAKNILKINLRYYSIVNILLEEELFFELYGPNLTSRSLYEFSKKVLFDETVKLRILEGCKKLKNYFDNSNANYNAAKIILQNI
ncbi:MAG: lipid-A-disaccharide synthase [Parachlamydiales bacterium]|nr:lipid-A-disaccharide synthase [Parachlamydiales bacterium]